jgi:hypothetical protein
MPAPETIDFTLLPGARRMLALHARALPQRDDLCGAFCGALVLGAAGLSSADGEPIDQDAVALAAGSVVSSKPDPGMLPYDEEGRRDYRLAIPEIDDAEHSGTTAAGVRDAVERLAAGALTAIPCAGPWNPVTLDGLYELALASPGPAALIANFATHHLWGSRPSAAQLLAHLLDGELDGPPPDWRVGHFSCVFGRMRGPAGSLYAIADTYPALGDRGVHMQPRERLAAALERADMPAGGMLAVVASQDAARVRAGARELGLEERIWDNGTVLAGRAA